MSTFSFYIGWLETFQDRKLQKEKHCPNTLVAVHLKVKYLDYTRIDQLKKYFFQVLVYIATFF